MKYIQFKSLKSLLLGCTFLAPLYGFSLTLEEAREAYQLGDYTEAAPDLRVAADNEPKNAVLNQMAGIASYYAGDENMAIPYLRRGQNESNLYLARIAMHGYRFDEADELLDRYVNGFRKNKREKAPELPEAEELRKDIEKGRSMLDRVEQIIIIDSIQVDRDDFFRFYRLASTAGQLMDPKVLPHGFEAAQPTVVYATENADVIYWAMPDSLENFRIASSSLLADRSWEKPRIFSDELNEGGDANFPFLMSDGVTLYFANTGENALGGYDIFISRRDGDDFLQPQNIGMPYNSYANDYMLAIDEETGLGWWASDRNCPTDRVNIYTFIPGELRINYPTDFPDLISRAKINSIRETWQPGKTYSDIRNRLADIDSERSRKNPDFYFAIPGRGIYISLDDFRSNSARQAMERYLTAKTQLSALNRKLSALRTSYGKGKTSVADEILDLERQSESMRILLRNLKNEVVTAEQ